jgi:hypothetical protein
MQNGSFPVDKIMGPRSDAELHTSCRMPKWQNITENA